MNTNSPAYACRSGTGLTTDYYTGNAEKALGRAIVGESPAAADAMGIDVVKYRYAHTLAGGAFADRSDDPWLSL